MLIIIICGYVGFRISTSAIPFLFLALLIGHSMASIAFLTHELSHNTIVRFRPLGYPLEVFFLGPQLHSRNGMAACSQPVSSCPRQYA
jgi:hypothetical protein